MKCENSLWDILAQYPSLTASCRRPFNTLCFAILFQKSTFMYLIIKFATSEVERSSFLERRWVEVVKRKPGDTETIDVTLTISISDSAAGNTSEALWCSSCMEESGADWQSWNHLGPSGSGSRTWHCVSCYMTFSSSQWHHPAPATVLYIRALL